ncbi:MAG: TIM barrel protein, partial [Verrucomicrobiae bacterium]|nr:TIM barrel protein [Verrucomicrobiae bacterium]
EMRSLYVNSSLHEAEQAEKSIQEILAIAKAARAVGTRIIVTNPNPIQWGGEQNKTDAQLQTQARALNSLGEQLADLDLKLAYHNHDIELRNAAREFHHMMVGTDPRVVHLCLDAHWVYRGSGNSAVALFDIVELYGKRVVELHVRQSHEGVWSEVFTARDDIDYARLVAALVRHGVRPLVVLEQAPEKGTPKTLTAVEAIRRSAIEARRVFAPLAG